MATWWRARASQSPAGHGYSFLPVSVSSAPGLCKSRAPGLPRRDSGERDSGAREAVEPQLHSAGAGGAAGCWQPGLQAPPPVGPAITPTPLRSALAIRGSREQPSCGGGRSGGGRKIAGSRPAGRAEPWGSSGSGGASAAPRGAAESGVPLHGSERTETAGCSWARAWKVCACARERVWGRQSRIRAEERAGEPSTAPSAPPPVP